MYVLCTPGTLKDTIRELKANGYEWLCGDMPPELIIKSLPKTKYIMINARYSEVWERKVMEYQSENWYKENENDLI